MFGGMLGLPELLLICLIGAIVILPYWQIFKKAGFAPGLSLLMIVPLANLVMLFYLAFAEWPSLRHQSSSQL